MPVMRTLLAGAGGNYFYLLIRFSVLRLEFYCYELFLYYIITLPICNVQYVLNL